MSDLPKYIYEREFNAPREMVWRAWTDPKLLARWYGPNVETVIHQFDLKPGGVWRNEMKMGALSDFSIMAFEDVSRPEKIVWRHSSADSDWNAAANAMMPDWPRVLRTAITFTETAGKTKVRLSQSPVDAAPAEIACFANMMSNMDGGWGKGFTILDEILAELGGKS